MLAFVIAWLCVIGASVAQIVRRPVIVNPAPTHAPSLQVDVDRARKMSVLHQWGLDHVVFGSPILVTPQHPEVEGARISFIVPGAAGATATTDLDVAPHGRITLPRERNARIAVTLTSTNPGQWWLLDCLVRSDVATGFDVYTRLPNYLSDSIRTSPPVLPDYGFAEGPIIVRGTLVREQPDHATVVFEPSAQTSRTFWIRSESFDAGWSFGGCELTPFRLSE